MKSNFILYMIYCWSFFIVFNEVRKCAAYIFLDDSDLFTPHIIKYNMGEILNYYIINYYRNIYSICKKYIVILINSKFNIKCVQALFIIWWKSFKYLAWTTKKSCPCVLSQKCFTAILIHAHKKS